MGETPDPFIDAITNIPYSVQLFIAAGFAKLLGNSLAETAPNSAIELTASTLQFATKVMHVAGACMAGYELYQQSQGFDYNSLAKLMPIGLSGLALVANGYVTCSNIREAIASENNQPNE